MIGMKNTGGLLEIMWVFALILAQIWLVPSNNLAPATITFIIMAVSWIRRVKNVSMVLKMVGLYNPSWNNFVRFWTRIFFFIAPITIVLTHVYRINFDNYFTGEAGGIVHFLVYFFWAGLQQLILCGYFALQLETIFEKKLVASALAGLLFAVVHLPNPLLVTIALPGGILCSYIFLAMEKKNLYFIAFAHAATALSLKYFLQFFIPHASTLNLRVGPGYFKT